MTNPANAEAAKIIFAMTMDAMVKKSGADVATILSVMIATPDGAAAKYFRAHIALGMQAATDVFAQMGI
jgi:hypothetical protein